MIKNLLFDFSNVLSDYDWQSLALRITGDAEKAKYLASKTVRDNDKWLDFDAGYLSEDELIAVFKSRIEPEYHGWVEQIVRGIDVCFSPIPGMYELVKELKDRGYGCYLVSNFPKEPFLRVSKDFPTLKLLDGMLVSYEDHLMKPNADIFLEALRRFGLKAEECLFTDDIDLNVRGARAVGIRGVVFENPAQLRAFLEKEGVL